MNRMTTTRSSKQAPLNSGTLSPNPWDLSLSGQNADAKLGGTRTEGRAPQGCDLSAVPSAEMATGGLDAEATQTPKQRPVQTLAYCGQKMVLTMGSTLASQTLEVEFNYGAVYRYAGVPLNEFEGLMNADSKGKYFNANIKTRYQFSKL